MVLMQVLPVMSKNEIGIDLGLQGLESVFNFASEVGEESVAKAFSNSATRSGSAFLPVPGRRPPQRFPAALAATIPAA